MLEDFVSEIPQGLEWADELLMLYGRWASSRSGGARTCASAEGAYRSPAVGDDDARRVPRVVAMTSAEALQVQRTLVRVPDRERTALHVLYVPQRLPVVAQLRMLQITPRDCRTRHSAGLRMFANLWRVVGLRTPLAPPRVPARIPPP